MSVAKAPCSGSQPFVQRIQRGKARDGLPEPVTRILDVLLDLPLLPTRCRIAELGFEEIVAGHRQEAGVDIALLPAADPVDGGLHVVIDAAAGNAAKDAEGVIVGVEQHLVRLQEVGPDDEGEDPAALHCHDRQRPRRPDLPESGQGARSERSGPALGQ